MTADAEIGKMGEPVSAGDWTVTVKSAEFSTKVGDIKVPRGVVLKIEADIKNGSGTKTVVRNQAFVLDAKGALYKPAADPADTNSQTRTIGAGRTEDMTLYYVLPKKSSGYKLVFTAPGGTGQATIRVK